MKIAIVGCGFVVDYDLAALFINPELELVGVTDRDDERAGRFAVSHSAPKFGSIDESSPMRASS
jgi:predicted dehydrogenase